MDKEIIKETNNKTMYTFGMNFLLNNLKKNNKDNLKFLDNDTIKKTTSKFYEEATKLYNDKNISSKKILNSITHITAPLIANKLLYGIYYKTWDKPPEKCKYCNKYVYENDLIYIIKKCNHAVHLDCHTKNSKNIDKCEFCD